MASRSKHLKENKHKNQDISGDKLILKLRKYPFFTLALIISIIIFFTFIYIQFSPMPSLSSRSTIAKSVYENNQYIIDEYILGLKELESEGFVDTLDDDYYYSMLDDLVWLKETETTLFNSKPIEDIYAKEAAFKYFFDKVIEANAYFTEGIDSSDYSGVINKALSLEAQSFNSYDELEPLFYGDLDENTFRDIMQDDESIKQKFFQQFNSLWSEYYSSKKILIQNSSSKERAYVEAKKLILLSYSTDSNLE